ncbi:hypothetical protein MUK42_34350 [Musa troglodytarum]|uniref:Uncharacterized protein n=1 Tax=Musa troglodytarum TaxID=320322 RepID=A0A9E7HB89_9LILI|nr:hypothetical protein MUK42_34350 [Musa troglodytarum]URE26973.1 hypothetical protein MUK42_34350 [Musa troglodytarum]
MGFSTRASCLMAKPLLMWEFYYNDHMNVDLQSSNILPKEVTKRRRQALTTEICSGWMMIMVGPHRKALAAAKMSCDEAPSNCGRVRNMCNLEYMVPHSSSVCTIRDRPFGSAASVSAPEKFINYGSCPTRLMALNAPIPHRLRL